MRQSVTGMSIWDFSEGRYMNIAQGFAYSSNVGMTRLEQKKWEMLSDGLSKPL